MGPESLMSHFKNHCDYYTNRALIQCIYSVGIKAVSVELFYLLTLGFTFFTFLLYFLALALVIKVLN